MPICSVRIEQWNLPLCAPFSIAQRTAYEAENVFITIETDDGQCTGYGASAPVMYVTGETILSVMSTVREVAEHLIGMPTDRLGPFTGLIADALADAPAARAGLEMAVYDCWAKGHRLSLWQYFGGATLSLDSDLTIPITEPEAAGPIARAAVKSGYRSLKVKVGATDGPDADLARIAAITRAAPGVRLRVDANQAFQPADAVSFAARLTGMNADVELIEQPVAAADIDGLKHVKDAVPYPVYADEAACSVANVLEILRRDAADGINIKLMKSGITGALQIISLCRAAGKDLMMGCMLETALGISAAAQIAAGTGAFAYIDLDSHHLLAPVQEISGGVQTCGPTISMDTKNSTYGWGVTVLPR